MRKKAVKRLIPVASNVESGKPSKTRKITVKPAEKPASKKRILAKNRRTPKIAWNIVRDTYVQGFFDENAENPQPRRWLNNAEIARMYNIHESSVSVHVRDEKWAAQREAFQKDLRAQEDARLASELADRRVRSQVAFATVGQNLASQVQAHVRVAQEKQRPIDPKSLRALAGTLRTSQQVVEVAFGKPADGEGSVHVDWAVFLTPPPPPVREALPDIDADAPEFGGVVTPPRSA
jgi:hypothetical protein